MSAPDMGKVWSIIRSGLTIYRERLTEGLNADSYERGAAVLDDVSRSMTDRVEPAVATLIAQARAEALEEAAVIAWHETDESHPRPWESWGEARNMVVAQTVAKEIAAAIRARKDEA